MLHSTYSYSIIFSCRTFIRLFDISFKKTLDRKSTRLNSSHANISYAVFCLKKKKQNQILVHLDTRANHDDILHISLPPATPPSHYPPNAHSIQCFPVPHLPSRQRFCFTRLC